MDTITAAMIEGFSKEAAAQGLNAEETAQLFHTAQRLALRDSAPEAFKAAYDATMEKQGIVLGPALLGMGALAGGKWLWNKFRGHVGKGYMNQQNQNMSTQDRFARMQADRAKLMQMYQQMHQQFGQKPPQKPPQGPGGGGGYGYMPPSWRPPPWRRHYGYGPPPWRRYYGRY
jgi:hypothetical protein